MDSLTKAYLSALKNPKKVDKCIFCKKVKTLHKSKTFHCPIGRKLKGNYQRYSTTIFTIKE